MATHKNKLPERYRSWLEFHAMIKERHSELLSWNTIKDMFIYNGYSDIRNNLSPQIETYDIDIDYMKAQCFDEMLNIWNSLKESCRESILHTPELNWYIRRFEHEIKVRTL